MTDTAPHPWLPCTEDHEHTPICLVSSVVEKVKNRLGSNDILFVRVEGESPETLAAVHEVLHFQFAKHFGEESPLLLVVPDIITAEALTVADLPDSFLDQVAARVAARLRLPERAPGPSGSHPWGHPS